MRISGATFVRYEDDKLVEERVFFDALQMMTQLRLVAPAIPA